MHHTGESSTHTVDGSGTICAVAIHEEIRMWVRMNPLLRAYVGSTLVVRLAWS